MEKSAIMIQKVVRGFLGRRRIRRFKIAQALEEEENLDEDEQQPTATAAVAANHHHIRQQSQPIMNVVSLEHRSNPLSPTSARTISFPLNLNNAISPPAPSPNATNAAAGPPSYPLSSRRSASPSPHSSPRRPDSAASSRSPRPSYHHLSQPHPFKDVATSPITSPSSTHRQPRFHLNLPTQQQYSSHSLHNSARKETHTTSHTHATTSSSHVRPSRTTTNTSTTSTTASSTTPAAH